ncbi:hypothetical protein SAMN00777080_2681 [Aquiflexum balticum DSM 16537]|uniref:Uncharacterized protein n=1 Tax=Aquiflexum balticum DSM 16537 TaxID=758820 RepID=A0A1W2H6E5_9BACT|nr:hypothetical protein SAMN00777080_2681 [Aquiflexum balticum DSM 16537]
MILAYTDLKMDPRPYRQIKSLGNDFEVHSAGTSKAGIEYQFHLIKKRSFINELINLPMLKFGFYDSFYWDKAKNRFCLEMKNISFDLVIAHEIRLVPLAIKIAGSAPVILDAHEYSPLNFDDDPFWRFFYKDYYIFLCSKFIPKVQQMITVSKGIVQEYKKNFLVEPVLVTNACEFKDLKPNPVGSKIKLLHHGIVSSSRSLEIMLDMMDFLNSDFELYLMLVFRDSTRFHWKRLVKKASKNPRIIFLKPVPREILVEYSNQFDVGLAFFPPNNFNLKFALPNKFFEYIQSRLMVLVGPDYEMSPLVRKYQFGVVSKEWTAESMAKSLSRLDKDEINRLKTNANVAALELNSEKQMEVLKKVVEGLI